MPHVRRPALAGLLAGLVVLVGGCSGTDPTDVPASPGTGASATSAPSSPGPAGTDPGASPSTDPTEPTEPPPSEPPPSDPQASGSEPDVEPSRPIETAPPKKLGEPARTAGATISVVSVRAATIKATAPGDRSGRGVLVRLELTNPTGRALDTRFVQVGVSDPAGAPATQVEGAPTEAFRASVGAGRRAQGTYAFVMDDPTGTVTVSVYVTSGQPVVTFRGRPS